MTPRAIPAGAVALLLATVASAQTFPARTGERGILDVPDADATGVGGGQVGLELRYDRVPGAPDDIGPLPVYAVAGATPDLDLGFTMREWGQAGDPRPGRLLVGGAVKLRLWKPSGLVPGAALSTILDRANGKGVLGMRLALSTSELPVRLAAFAGLEAISVSSMGPAAGIAVSVPMTKKSDLAVEALAGFRGQNVGGAFRYKVNATTGISLGASYFPSDHLFRVTFGIAIGPPERARLVQPQLREAPPEELQPGVPRYTDDRPHFRLRMPLAGPQLLAEPHRLQYGAYTGPAVAAARPVAPPVKSAAPTLDELADVQVREQEALADARDKRVRATSDQIDAREKAALENARKLEERERELTAREQQLDAREQRTAIKTAPTQQQRQLQALEAQLAAQERQLLAQERSLAPAIEAARGRERDAAAREDSERQEANRLSASAGGAPTRAAQVELRKQALAAKNRQLAAFETKLVAKGERADAVERQLRGKGERLDTWSRRLDTRSERLDLAEKHAADARPAPAPRPAEPPKPAAAPKDKAVFVMVVKSPTAIVKERATAPAAGPAGAALHPGVAVEKAVAAATVVTFPTPTSQISELDRETLDNIAKLAAREKCELLVWARAKDPALMPDAQRRADEIKARAIKIGPLDAKQVVTRITTRPGAQGVDVVVSALRETARPAGPASAPAPSAAALLAGESGKRQIRDAVVAAQPSIEACVGDHIEQRKLERAEGVLKLTVSTQGRVAKVTTGGGDLAGGVLEECLGRASGAWAFPAADAEYVVDVPITVMRGGTAK